MSSAAPLRHAGCGGRLIHTGGGWVVCATCRQSVYLGKTPTNIGPRNAKNKGMK